MRKDQGGNNPKSGRSRALNVIYFIDAHKTRSFHLTLSKLNLVLIVIFCLTSWAFASMYLVARSFEERDAQSDRLHTALATIFEYQSRYDGVYESAYPDTEQERERERDLVASDSSRRAAGTDAPKIQLAHADGALAEQSSNDFAVENLHVHSSAGSAWPITIEDLSVHRDEDELELSFAIRNKTSPSRSEGYVWAIATLLKQNGETDYLGSPRGLVVSEGKPTGDLTKFANWYSIRYYKAKSFYFSLPPQWQGRIASFDIGMLDTSGKQTTFTVTIAQPARPAAPPADRTEADAEVDDPPAPGPIVSKARESHAQSK